jgi:transposase
MPGKSKLTADAAGQAALRAPSQSEQRGEADRARAILLTLPGRPAGEIAAALGVHVSTVRNWLTLEWLPKYAPELNDIERCWRDLKQHYRANRTFADADARERPIPDTVARLDHERQPHPSPIPYGLLEPSCR